MMTKKIMKPLLGAMGVTALSFGTMLGFTAPAFADAVAPVVIVTGPNCSATPQTRTILATLAPGQVLQGFAVTMGPAANFTRITDTNGFTEDFPPSATPTPFTIVNTSNNADTVSACVSASSTTGVVSLQVFNEEGNPVGENDRNRRITITINNTPIAKVEDSGNSHNNNDNVAKVKDSGNSHNDIDNRNTSKVKSGADAISFIKLHGKLHYYSYE